jgi:hypothetical protein
MSELNPIGGIVFVNGDTGEVTVTPYTQEQIDQMIELGLIKDASEVNK